MRYADISTSQEPGFEEWRPIKGYEGLYDVSNHGNVRSLNYHMKPGKVVVITQYPDKGGYLRVRLSKGGKMVTLKVHRAVAEAFIPNPEEKPEVNHIDGNTKNNTVSNLEWVTASENMKHAVHVTKHVANPNIRRVDQKEKDGSFIRTWDSARSAALALGIDPSAITKCCKGKLRQTGGFVWEYVKEAS